MKRFPERSKRVAHGKQVFLPLLIERMHMLTHYENGEAAADCAWGLGNCYCDPQFTVES